MNVSAWPRTVRPGDKTKHDSPLALSPERQSPRTSKIKNGGLDQYGAGPFKQQQFGTAGVKWVKPFN